ncbi:MAG: toxic anion resistance protein [Clostridiales Family XIII bacterium]|jgi:uncharacterized protein YaaN involved in tellurite resistance|nr:toxic anion resistance protein [Clostridiales Family XIII bacterium]
MSEVTNNTQVPVLTLTPEVASGAETGTVPAPAEAQFPVTQGPAYSDTITESTPLSPEEQLQVTAFAKTIDLTDSNIIMMYGAGAQSKMTAFSEQALSGVRTKDMGEIGKMISGLVTELKSFDTDGEQSKGLFGLFKKGSNKVTEMKAKFATAEKNVEGIKHALEKHQITLMKDASMLDKMYEQNVLYFKELTMYILAGKEKLREVETAELPALQAKAKETGKPEDAQAANDLANRLDRFAKKLHDLELTRTIALQMAPQIRLVQNNDIVMTEKIQSTIVNTIPLWKSQMVLALGVEHSRQAAEAQREVSEMTNELLRKNSATLKQATITTAQESERGVVEIETLQSTNKDLIETLDEVARIQSEGRQKRAVAETELARIEVELKNKLIELKN